MQGKETTGLHTCNNLVDHNPGRRLKGLTGEGEGDSSGCSEHFEVCETDIYLNGFKTSIMATSSKQVRSKTINRPTSM